VPALPSTAAGTSPGEIRTAQVRLVERRVHEIGVAKVGVPEICLDEHRAHEAGVGKLRCRKVGEVQAGLVELGTEKLAPRTPVAQVGARHDRIGEVRAGGVREPKCSAREVGRRRLAFARFTPNSLASSKKAPFSLAPVSVAPLRSAPVRFAPLNVAPARSAMQRSAPADPPGQVFTRSAA